MRHGFLLACGAMRLHPGALFVAVLIGCATGASDPDGGPGSDGDGGVDPGADAAVGEALTVTAPNGGELWINGVTVEITWVPGGLDTVEVELLKGGSPVSTLATGAPDTGSLDWTIPINLEAGADYRVRVSATDDPAMSDESDADFAIELRQLTVTSPNGGEAVVAGEPLTVQWTSTDNVTTVDVILLAGGVEVETLAAGVANSGSHVWTPAFDRPAGLDYGIRVRDAASIAFDDSDAAFAVRNWQYRRAVTITAPASALASWPVLVELTAPDFDFAQAGAGGADLRFATTPDRAGGVDLSHWIESWSGASARVWVRVPMVPAGSSATIYLFHGMPEAVSTSSQDAVFPSRFVSTSSLTLGGQQSFDLFHLQPGHTLTIQTGQVLRIDARIVIIAGSISGNGAGYTGGDESPGGGPGGGGPSNDAGAGGGGHGGTGGNGGYDPGDNFGAGGAANGNATDASIDMGSGGGGTDNQDGGRGGGAVAITGHTVTVSGAITVNGAAGGGGSGRNGGGGAGGGILIAGYDVAVSSPLRARGGKGGDGSSSANDGGGGGAGGRVKVLHTRDLTDTATRDVISGAGGLHGSAQQGQPGAAGTAHTGTFAGVEPDVTVSAETALY
jgi:hypothetical protein